MGLCSLLQRGELSVKSSWMVNSRRSTSQLLVLKDFWRIHLSERRILYSERLLILNKLRKGELFEIMLPWTATKPRHVSLSLNNWRYWGHSLKFVMQRARRDTPGERRRGLKPRRGLVDRVAFHRNSRKLREEKLHFKQTLLNECGASKTSVRQANWQLRTV